MEYNKVKIKHSESKDAWNIVGTIAGRKYKIARIPYHALEDSKILTTMNKAKALEHAQFICKCFNSDKLIEI